MAIVEGLESNDVNLYDSIKCDIGTISEHNDIWTQSLDYLSRGSTYSTLSGDESNRLTYTTITGDIGIEFDVMCGYDSTRFVTIRNGSTALQGASLLDLGLDADNWHHIQIRISDGYCTISNTTTSDIIVGSVTNFNRLYLNAIADNYLSFKNFTVYSIGTQPQLTVTADKDILSYYDEDSATITATYTEGGVGVAGKTVSFTFLQGSTTVETQTATTDSNGVASVSYSSKGSGDLSINVECMNLLETYSVEDCLLYRASMTSTSSLNVTLPQHFTISANVTRTSGSNSYCYYQLTHYDAGVLREKGSLSVRIKDSGPFADNNTSIIPLNTVTPMVYEYNNGSHSLTANNTTVSGTETTYTIGSFTGIYIAKYTVTNVKIKPL